MTSTRSNDDATAAAEPIGELWFVPPGAYIVLELGGRGGGTTFSGTTTLEQIRIAMGQHD